jgi:hypothetical protein
MRFHFWLEEFTCAAHYLMVRISKRKVWFLQQTQFDNLVSIKDFFLFFLLAIVFGSFSEYKESHTTRYVITSHDLCGRNEVFSYKNFFIFYLKKKKIKERRGSVALTLHDIRLATTYPDTHYSSPQYSPDPDRSRVQERSTPVSPCMDGGCCLLPSPLLYILYISYSI